MNAAPEVEVGGRVSEERKKELEELRKLYDPAASNERVDKYATWVFGGTTAVSAFTALYTKSLVGELGAHGRLLASAALLGLAVAMAMAGLSLAPTYQRLNPNSIESMRDALDQQTRRKRWKINTAGVALGLALVLLGLAPLRGSARAAFPRKQPPRESARRALVTSAVSFKGGVSAELTVTGAQPYGPLRLELAPVRNGKAAGLIARTVGAADSIGSGKAELKVDSTAAAGGTYLLSAWIRPRGAAKDSLAASDTLVLSARTAAVP